MDLMIREKKERTLTKLFSDMEAINMSCSRMMIDDYFIQGSFFHFNREILEN